jgi:hypothetical protein
LTVKRQAKIDFSNECECLVDYSELEKAILWYQQKPSLSKKKIYLHGHYPAVSIHNEKVHVHRLLMQYWLRTKLPFEYSVHHLNENKLDARKENLSLILNKTHNSEHNKGKVLSETHRQKIGKANHNRKGMKMKKRVLIPKEELKVFVKEGKSINWIAQHYGCDWSTVRARIYENQELLEVDNED